MQLSYLLDTSAFQALSPLILQKNNFYASPYCFWEQLTHLDEGKFARYKGQLMKFRYVHILNDPRAHIETPLLLHDILLQSRVSDGELIAATHAALEASDSLEAFYASHIKDSNGEIRQVSDCAARVRTVLQEAEYRHVEFIQNIIKEFRFGGIKLGTPLDYHQAILQLLEGEIIKLQRRGAVGIDLRRSLINASYIYYSYIFYRALAYFKGGKTKLDINDFEDGQICLHLTLDTQYCLVTADKGFKEAIDKTIIVLSLINDPHTHTALQVIDTNFF